MNILKNFTAALLLAVPLFQADLTAQSDNLMKRDIISVRRGFRGGTGRAGDGKILRIGIQSVGNQSCVKKPYGHMRTYESVPGGEPDGLSLAEW